MALWGHRIKHCGICGKNEHPYAGNGICSVCKSKKNILKTNIIIHKKISTKTTMSLSFSKKDKVNWSLARWTAATSTYKFPYDLLVEQYYYHIANDGKFGKCSVSCCRLTSYANNLCLLHDYLEKKGIELILKDYNSCLT